MINYFKLIVREDQPSLPVTIREGINRNDFRAL
jgi:hypothetical protein